MLRSLGLALGLGLLAGAVVSSPARAQLVTDFDGQYVGELVLTRIIDGDCTQPPLGAQYPLRISGGEVRFAYVPRFATTLVGKIGRNGSFKASARAKKGVVQMTGTVRGGDVSASIISPSCNYSFHAHR